MTASIPSNAGEAQQAYPAPNTPTCGARVSAGLNCVWSIMPATNVLITVGAVGLSVLRNSCMNPCAYADPAWIPSSAVLLGVGVGMDVAAFIYGAVKGPRQAAQLQNN